MKKSVVSLFVVLILNSMVACAAPPKSLTEVRAQQLSAIRQSIREITPAQLAQMQENGKFVLLDVREANERGLTIPAKNEADIPRGLIEWQAEKKLNAEEQIVVYCRTGERGAYAVKQLNDLGYRNAVNLKGGIAAWLEAGYPVKTFNLGEVTLQNYRFKK